jgi:hypothetical protein
MFENFVRDAIVPQELEFLHPLEREVKKHLKHEEVKDFIETFHQALRQVFVFFGSARSQKSIDYKFIHLSFQDTFEIVWRLGFFPTKISKDVIRHYYFYTLTKD